MSLTEWWSLDVQTQARLIAIHEVRLEVSEAQSTAAKLKLKEKRHG